MCMCVWVSDTQVYLHSHKLYVPFKVLLDIVHIDVRRCFNGTNIKTGQINECGTLAGLAVVVVADAILIDDT